MSWTLLIPLGMLLMGAVMAWLAFTLLAEYRRAFFADAKAVMSLEVLTHIVQFGGTPGYLGVFLLVAAMFLIISGAVGTFMEMSVLLQYVLHLFFPETFSWP